MRRFFVEKVKAIVSNVDYEKSTMHVENIDVPYFDTDDEWEDFVSELNVANRADRISGRDLALEMNGGKTAHINRLDIDIDYVNDGGENELPEGELEVSFVLVSKESTYDLRELWFGDKPVYVTYRATSKNIDIDIDVDESEDIDKEYTEEFFESVYRESQDPSTKDSEKEADGEIIDQLGNAIDKDFYRVIDEFKKHGEVNKVEVIPLEEFERQDGDIYSITDYFYAGNVEFENAKTHFSQWLPDDGKSDYVVKIDVTYAPNRYYSKSANFSYYLYRSEDVDGSTYRISDIQLYTYDEILEELLKEPEGEKEFISLANRMINR